MCYYSIDVWVGQAFTGTFENILKIASSLRFLATTEFMCGKHKGG